MRTIRIAHLYYDILNLYGENGNIKALKKELENQGINVEVHFLTIDDDFNVNDYDFIYMGAGTETNQEIVIPDLLKHKKEIKEAIKNNKFFLVTGNAMELFGKYLLIDGEEKETLGIFGYHAKREEFRMIDECIMECEFLKKPIIGFQNQSSIVKDIKHPMFKVIKGIGSYPKALTEGIHYHHFYGTYVIGPILARNPEFLKYIVTKLILSIDSEFKFKKFNLKENEEAYDTFVRTFYQNVI